MLSQRQNRLSRVCDVKRMHQADRVSNVSYKVLSNSVQQAQSRGPNPTAVIWRLVWLSGCCAAVSWQWTRFHLLFRVCGCFRITRIYLNIYMPSFPLLHSQSYIRCIDVHCVCFTNFAWRTTFRVMLDNVHHTRNHIAPEITTKQLIKIFRFADCRFADFRLQCLGGIVTYRIPFECI